MSLRKSCTPLEKGLPIAQSKLGVNKRNYHATMKFQDSWAVMLPWAKLRVRMTICTSSNVNFFNEVEGKNKLLLPKWDFFVSMYVAKRLKRILGPM
jgi:hypothetical protein